MSKPRHPYVLVGAGGHARAVVEAAGGDGLVNAYVDPSPCAWLTARHIESDGDAEPGKGGIVLGIGGTGPEQLRRRLALLDAYLERGFTALTVVHPTAHVSPAAELAPGAIVLAKAVVQPGARIERGGLVNTGAIVEHDSVVGAGSHIAPGAVILGGCEIGACSLVGANAVVLPFAVLRPGSLAAAAERHAGIEKRTP